MAIIKCKMCGGDLTFTEGATVAECEYCGSMQTIPNRDNEKKLTLFVRANRLRRACEFDKAAGIYESIVAEFPEEAEAYWGLVLCRYGIEYVDDPQTGKKIPTCHRSSFDSIIEDSDFEQTLENADVVARKVYRDEAKAIEELRKGILEVSGKEEPYDIFICYKETDDKGERTIDSVIAQDVYDALTEKGYRVFFSRISLEDKLGTEYEPYIFAALNSAKVMLAFGTDYEYYNTVWVKNEWSRFLALIAAGQKKTLIPCYKGIDAYNMPKEFAKLQAQDMGKMGAIQDLLRGIDKIMDSGAAERPQGSAAVQRSSGGTAGTDALLKRGYMALEDGKWKDAKNFFNRVLDIDPELAQAYLGLVMADVKCQTAEDFKGCYISATWEDDRNIARAKQYATPELQKKFERWDAERAEKEATAAKLVEKEKARRTEMKPIYAQHRKWNALAAKQICSDHNHRIFGLNTDGTMAAGGFDHRCEVGDWSDIVAIAAGYSHIVGLNADGTVLAYAGRNVYGQGNVSDWTDIVAITAGGDHTVGLKSDGTVVAVGDNERGQCNVDNWTDIVAIAVEKGLIVGLKSDGTAVTTSCGCDVSSWTDIVAIAVETHEVIASHAFNVRLGGRSIVGLKADGTVVVAGVNMPSQCYVGDWTDIVAIAASNGHIVGLKSDGTVVAVGDNERGQCNVDNWTDIVAIDAGHVHTVGLKTDGTVVAAGFNGGGQCNVNSWTDIVAVTAGPCDTVGIKSDGTVVNTKNPDWTNDWKLFDHIDTLEQEIEEMTAQAKERRQAEQAELEKKRRQEEERLIAHRVSLERNKSTLQAELNNIKGLFTGRCRRELEARLAEIEAELERL